MSVMRDVGSTGSVFTSPLAGVVACSAVMAVFAAWWIIALGPPPLGEGVSYSTLVVDRDGRLLRPYTTPDGRWRLPATRAQVDPRFLDILLAYEDKRYLSHRGVDPLALARAVSQLAVNGRDRKSVV